MISIKTILTAVLSVVLFGVTQAWACDCVGPGASCANSAAVVFVGKVRSIEQAGLPVTLMGNRAVTFDVLETLRGDTAKTMVIRSDLNGSSTCGLPFAVGDEWLIFSDMWQGFLHTSSCSGSSPSRNQAGLIRQLRARREGAPVADVFGFVRKTTPVGAGNTNTQPASALTVSAKSSVGEYRTRTAADGFYEFRGLPAGDYTVTVSALPGERELASSSQTRRVDRAEACINVDLRAPEGPAKGVPK